jgi:CDP-2,3-bis-(O-geranylgeranyl)-sn-glycerol synthase
MTDGLSSVWRWIPADQLDFVIGALALIAPLVMLSWWDVTITLAISFIGDIVVNQLAFRLGVRDSAW